MDAPPSSSDDGPADSVINRVQVEPVAAIHPEEAAPAGDDRQPDTSNNYSPIQQNSTVQGSPSIGKGFEWYKVLLEQARWEATYGWTRFSDASKLHLTLLAGVLALSTYALATHDIAVWIIALITSFFGLWNAVALHAAIKSSARWEGRWFRAAAEVEVSENFQKEVLIDVKALSSVETILHFDPKKNKLVPQGNCNCHFL